MTDVEVSESVFAVNGINLNVAQAGTGSPVVLLHGFPDRWQVWRHQIPALVEAGYHVVAPDLRGFGASDRPANVADYAMPRLIGDVLGLLDALGLPRVAVVAHDWGAGLAWNLAMARPERVTELAVISVGHGGTAGAAGLRQREMSWYMLWFLFEGVAEQVLPREDWAFYRRWAWGGAGASAPAGAATDTNVDVERQIADLSRPGALTAGLNWYRANIRPDRFVPPEQLPPLPRVSCPTMGIWSSDDMALGETQMQESGAFVDGPWRYERIDGCDHWVPVHAPEQLTALLLDFLT